MDLQTHEICEAAAGAFERASTLFNRDAGLYLAHCVSGLPIRRAAAAIGAAPSTVSRAVRRVEALRDDPLMDFAFERFEAAFAAQRTETTKMEIEMPKDVRPTKQELNALSRLTEPEAFLMVAKGADKAGVFCRKNNFRRPLMMAPLAVASRMLTHERSGALIDNLAGQWWNLRRLQTARPNAEVYPEFDEELRASMTG
ncbi:MAG: DUF1592 domain-containing protein, partial [Pseudomonadota bacterium]